MHLPCNIGRVAGAYLSMKAGPTLEASARAAWLATTTHQQQMTRKVLELCGHRCSHLVTIKADEHLYLFGLGGKRSGGFLD